MKIITVAVKEAANNAYTGKRDDQLIG